MWKWIITSSYFFSDLLFLSKINPFRACNKLYRQEIKSLINNIRKILKIAINEGGASIKDFKNTEGKKGKFQQLFNVYGLENINCSCARF